MPTCKRCGAAIEFIRTPAGKWMPVQQGCGYAELQDDGPRLAIDQQGRVVRIAEIVGGTPFPGGVRVYLPHWEFCSGAEEMRKPKAAPPSVPQAQPASRLEPEEQPEQISFLEDKNGSKRENHGYWRL